MLSETEFLILIEGSSHYSFSSVPYEKTDIFTIYWSFYLYFL